MYGYDVSGFQPANITSAATSYDFVLIKASEGTGYRSASAAAQYAGAAARDKLTGFYHFADGGNVTAEVDNFLAAVKPYIGKSLLVLDLEAGALTKWGAAGAKQFLDLVKSRTGVTPLIYGSRGNICNSAYAAIANAGYPLWVAAYASGVTAYGVHTPGNVAPWKSYAIYQFTSSGRLAGYSGNLDLNISGLTTAQWKQLATPGAKAPTAAAPIASTPSTAPAGKSSASARKSSVMAYPYMFRANTNDAVTIALDSETGHNVDAPSWSNAASHTALTTLFGSVQSVGTPVAQALRKNMRMI